MEIDKKEFVRLLRKYLNGKASQEEKAFLEAYYSEMEPRGGVASDHEAYLERIMTRVEADLLEAEIFAHVLGRVDQTVAPVHRLVSSRRKAVYLKYAAVAACIAILGATAIFLYVRWHADPYAHVYARRGEVRQVKLSDGSVAWLNADSRLTFRKKFGDSSRDVYLEGEGYFEVAKDDKHPFLVHTQTLTTRVLGTKFDVHAYPGDRDIQVTLLEGKVMLTAPSLNPIRKKEDTLFLAPNQKAFFADNGLQLRTSPSPSPSPSPAKASSPGRKTVALQTQTFITLSAEPVADAREAATWKDGELVFHGEALRDVMQTLSRAYNIEVKASSYLLDRPVTATLNAGTPEDALLEIIRRLGRGDQVGSQSVGRNIQFRKEGNVYYIE